VTRTVPDPDLDVLFGLMANAKFLLCDELLKACVEAIKTRLRSRIRDFRIKARRRDGHHKPVIAHPSFCPDVVPIAVIADMLVDPKISAGVRLEMVLAWLEKSEGSLPEADQDLLRPLVENFTNGTVRIHGAPLADACKRFPTGAVMLGPGLLVGLARRVRHHAQKKRSAQCFCGGSAKRQKLLDLLGSATRTLDNVDGGVDLGYTDNEEEEDEEEEEEEEEDDEEEDSYHHDDDDSEVYEEEEED
jgi:hypothetical protein